MIEIRHKTTNSVLYTADADTLYDANLSDADLKGANLKGANLKGANLVNADLVNADLKGANLYGANLRDANLRGADLMGAILSHANLKNANLKNANLSHTNLKDTKGLPIAPVIPNLDTTILTAIEDGGTLKMTDWHICETTHCRAGWAIHSAGEAGYMLEEELGPSVAGALIYHASTGRVPDFYASNAAAMTDIRRCAEGEKS